MRKIFIPIFLTAVFALSGCTGKSTRVALEGYDRAEEVRTQAVQNLRDGLRQAIFANALARIEAGEPAEVVLREAMQNRDRLQSMEDQIVLAQTLEMVTVRAKLIDDQGILNLLIGKVAPALGKLQPLLNDEESPNIFERPDPNVDE